MTRDDILLSEIEPDPQQPRQIFESLDIQENILKDIKRKINKLIPL